jgi:hypothetical protein
MTTYVRVVGLQAGDGGAVVVTFQSQCSPVPSVSLVGSQLVPVPGPLSQPVTAVVLPGWDSLITWKVDRPFWMEYPPIFVAPRLGQAL